MIPGKHLHGCSIGAENRSHSVTTLKSEVREEGRQVKTNQRHYSIPARRPDSNFGLLTLAKKISIFASLQTVLK
jgi:hypothetical protein